MEQVYDIVVDSYVDKVHHEWVETEMRLLVIAYDVPKTVVPINEHEQRGQADRLQANSTRFDQTFRAPPAQSVEFPDVVAPE